NCGPFASLFGLFQTHFGDKACVNKIQLADCQCLKSVAKIAYLRPGGCSLRISQAERLKMNK
ncbi:hypothetical protein, partial [Segatella buccae]|uniref:hypothetical protein n=1 Tax=Segatella buccae TaxID=28126 RepID=UPI003FD8B291